MTMIAKRTAADADGCREGHTPSCHDGLRAATQAPPQRLHGHSGFSAILDGTIGPNDYRALLVRLYGFYQPYG